MLHFYRGICPCAVRAARAIRAARLDKSSLASLHTSPRASAFLQVIVAVFLKAKKRRQWQCLDKTSS